MGIERGYYRMILGMLSTLKTLQRKRDLISEKFTSNYSKIYCSGEERLKIHYYWHQGIYLSTTLMNYF